MKNYGFLRATAHLSAFVCLLLAGGHAMAMQHNLLARPQQAKNCQLCNSFKDMDNEDNVTLLNCGHPFHPTCWQAIMADPGNFGRVGNLCTRCSDPDKSSRVGDIIRLEQEAKVAADAPVEPAIEEDVAPVVIAPALSWRARFTNLCWSTPKRKAVTTILSAATLAAAGYAWYLRRK